MKPDLADNTAYFRCNPDFDQIKSYLYPGYSVKKYKQFVSNFQLGGSIIHCYFMDDTEGESFIEQLTKIIIKHELEDHGSNLSYMFLVLFIHSITISTEYKIPATKDAKTIQNFVSQINRLLQYPKHDFNIAFRRRSIKEEVLFDDITVAEWVKTTLLAAIEKGSYPKFNGTQLYGSQIVGEVNTRSWEYRLHENVHVLHDSKRTIITDEVMNISVPLLNYLQFETNLKKGINAKTWSFDQLSFIADLLFLTPFFKCTDKRYKSGFSTPSTRDKKTLYNTLNNKINEGKILIP